MMISEIGIFFMEPQSATGHSPEETSDNGSVEDRPRLAVIVATRDRVDSLALMLDSLAGEWDDIAELLVIDNGSSDGTAALLESRARSRPELRVLRWEPPGKAEALNQGKEQVSAPLVAFLDDDIRVRPGWARAYIEAAHTLPHPAFQGQVLLPIDDEEQREAVLQWRMYRTLPWVASGSPERRSLTGANMAIRRTVLDSVGWFDPRLGPGASGLAEDSEIADRIIAAFGAPVLVPGAVVDHELDRSRLTPAYFREYNRRMGRSRYIQKRNSLLFSIVPNLTKAGVLWAATLPWNGRRRHSRQLGRFYQYREMLREKLHGRSGSASD
jgi:GT2 family glycosyltransferase